MEERTKLMMGLWGSSGKAANLGWLPEGESLTFSGPYTQLDTFLYFASLDLAHPGARTHMYACHTALQHEQTTFALRVLLGRIGRGAELHK